MIRMKWTIVLMLLGVPGLCGISGSVALSRLISKANQVVVATVKTVNNASGQPGIQLLINRQIKGSLNPPETVAVLLPSGRSYTFLKVLTSLVGKSGIWFLNTNNNSEYVLPTVTGEVFPADMFIEVPSDDLPAKFVETSDTDPRARVLAELKAAAINPRTADTVSKLLARKMLDDGMGAESLHAFFNEISSSNVSSGKIAGLAGRIRSSQGGSVAELLKVSLASLSQSQVAMIARAICDYRGTDVEGIAALATLSQVGGAQNVRECAAHALREIHTRDAVNPLVALFDSSDAKIRYDAVIGIAQYAMKFPLATSEQKNIAMSTFRPDSSVTDQMRQNYPRIDLFAQNEERYISFWRTWVANHRAQ